jgi:hypothetical protein
MLYNMQDLSICVGAKAKVVFWKIEFKGRIGQEISVCSVF